MDNAVYYLKSLALFGIVTLVYCLILGLIEIIVRKQVVIIKTAVNNKQPNTFDISKEHILNPGTVLTRDIKSVGYYGGYWNNLRQESFGIDLKSSIKDWKELKRKVFKEVDVDNDFGISKNISILKGYYFLNKLLVYVAGLTFVGIIFMIACSALTGHSFALISGLSLNF